MDWFWGFYFLIGCVFAFHIIAKTWWNHWKTAVPGAVIAILIIPLWLPVVVIGGLVVWWAFWSRARTVRRRNAVLDGRRRRSLDAVKDKHGIDDAEVTARVIEQIKTR